MRNQKLIFAWGMPAVFVSVGTIAGFCTNTYMNKIEQYGYPICWLNKQTTVYYVTVLAPSVLIYVLNISMFIKIIHFVYVMSKKSVNFRRSVRGNEYSLGHIRVTLKSFAMLFPVMGPPSIITFLSGKLNRTGYLNSMLK